MTIFNCENVTTFNKVTLAKDHISSQNMVVLAILNLWLLVISIDDRSLYHQQPGDNSHIKYFLSEKNEANYKNLRLVLREK